MRDKRERSKVFRLMGRRVGIKNQMKSHRGIVAKKYLDIMDDFETRELQAFESKLPNLFELGRAHETHARRGVNI